VRENIDRLQPQLLREAIITRVGDDFEGDSLACNLHSANLVAKPRIDTNGKAPSDMASFPCNEVGPEPRRAPFLIPVSVSRTLSVWLMPIR
jgi:hypothetical protein